jgi:hypothetical protein
VIGRSFQIGSRCLSDSLRIHAVLALLSASGVLCLPRPILVYKGLARHQPSPSVRDNNVKFWTGLPDLPCEIARQFHSNLQIDTVCQWILQCEHPRQLPLEDTVLLLLRDKPQQDIDLTSHFEKYEAASDFGENIVWKSVISLTCRRCLSGMMIEVSPTLFVKTVPVT